MESPHTSHQEQIYIELEKIFLEDAATRKISSREFANNAWTRFWYGLEKEEGYIESKHSNGPIVMIVGKVKTEVGDVISFLKITDSKT